MLNSQNSMMRIGMSKKFMEMKISPGTREKIAKVFGNTPEDKKEKLAEKIIAAIECGVKEEKLIQIAKEFE